MNRGWSLVTALAGRPGRVARGRSTGPGWPPRRRPRTGAAGVGVVAVLCAASVAVPAHAAAPPTARSLDGVGTGAGMALLRRAASAALTATYSGTQFVSSWTRAGATSVVVDVAHAPGLGSTVAVTPTVAGEQTSIFTRDEALPGGAEVDPGAGPSDGRALDLLARHYEVGDPTPVTCAGRSAQLVEVRRRGGAAATAGRFWIDDASGLVLRRETLDSTGRAVRASAFVQVEVGAAALPPVVGRTGPAPAGTKLTSSELEEWRRSGWAVPSGLPHELAMVESRRSLLGDGRSVLQLSYSDGLSSVSVFQQRGRLDPESVRGWRSVRLGGHDVHVLPAQPEQVAWAADGTVYTLLADAPPEDVEAAVASLPHQTERPGLMGRLGRGLERVGSWLNPFD